MIGIIIKNLLLCVVCEEREEGFFSRAVSLDVSSKHVFVFCLGGGEARLLWVGCRRSLYVLRKLG